jgi:micrococcal nuclease
MIRFIGFVLRVLAGGYRRTQGTPPTTSGRAAAEVLWILDGDTVDVRMEGRKVRIRLYSIDCPENGQPWGGKAKAGLIKMVGGKPVVLEVHGVDDYGRTLATVFARQGLDPELTNVNERMVMLGHAWVMRRRCGHLSEERRRQLFRLEAWARSKQVGVWGTPSPMPPWKWRRGQ